MIIRLVGQKSMPVETLAMFCNHWCYVRGKIKSQIFYVDLHAKIGRNPRIGSYSSSISSYIS